MIVEKLPPALRAYIERIGADQLSFKSFIVRVWRDQYYIEKDIIRIKEDDCTITCNNTDYEPTDEEMVTIGRELPDYIKTWPKSLDAEHTDALRRLLRDKGAMNPLLFEFYRRDAEKKNTTGIVMVQERIEKPDGSKSYVPWSYWNDGIWRMMEPQHAGGLPFWKPKAFRGQRQIMCHEGPKVAMYCDRLVNDPELRDELAAHPWGHVLREYEHWGAIGGALAPQRSNYQELQEQRFSDLVYVCDNDYAGKSVAQIFSKYYRKKMKAVMFADGWGAKGWDMAEKMPADRFGEEGRYIGPTLESLMKPATRATELVPTGDGKKKAAKLLPDFCEEWLHSVSPDMYIHRDFPDQLWSPDQFNDIISPYSDVVDTARLMKGNAAVKSIMVKYDPSRPSGVQDDAEQGQFINTFVGPAITAEVGGDVAPFLEFMEHLIPDPEDRDKLLRWCATLISRPDIRMNYGVLLISETQGVGKGTLGEKVLLPLVGKQNSSVPSENDVVTSEYNYWLAHKRLAVVHEIYAGHSSKAYNKLKSTITDAKIMVRRKYVDEYTIDNWIHIFACSNSARALQLTVDDRRWLVPGVTERKREHSYWREFNLWLLHRGGLRKIRAWADKYTNVVGVVYAGAESPWTTKKREIIEEGYSPGMQIIDKLLHFVELEYSGKGAFITDAQLVDVIRNALYEGKPNDRLERPMTLRKLAKSRGWHVSKSRAFIQEWGCRLQGPRLLLLDSADADAAPNTLAAAGRKPLDVVSIASRLLGL